MYYYVLGCVIACLCLTGRACMESMEVKMAPIAVKSLLWPVALCAAVKRSTSMKRVSTVR